MVANFASSTASAMVGTVSMIWRFVCAVLRAARSLISRLAAVMVVSPDRMPSNRSGVPCNRLSVAYVPPVCAGHGGSLVGTFHPVEFVPQGQRPLSCVPCFRFQHWQNVQCHHCALAAGQVPAVQVQRDNESQLAIRYRPRSCTQELGQDHSRPGNGCARRLCARQYVARSLPLAVFGYIGHQRAIPAGHQWEDVCYRVKV